MIYSSYYDTLDPDAFVVTLHDTSDADGDSQDSVDSQQPTTGAQRRFEQILKTSILDGNGGFYAPRRFSRFAAPPPEKTPGDIGEHMRSTMSKLGIS